MKTRLVNKILVVDDTEIMRDLLAEVLHNDGYQVDKAADGIMAVDMVTRNQYDLVITDMHMPRQNGLITARRIRQLAPQLMIIMTDSYPDKLGDAASREGVIAMICKPFDLTELRKVMLRIEELMAARCKSVDKE
jgi:two-component system, NtrC family, response regulator PilR